MRIPTEGGHRFRSKPATVNRPFNCGSSVKSCCMPSPGSGSFSRSRAHDDVRGGRLNVAAFRVPPEREAWFHAVGRKEFGVALLQVAEMLAAHADTASLAARMKALARDYVSVTIGAAADVWESATGRTSGVWAHFAENIPGGEDKPSAAWSALAPHFAFAHRIDAQAARWYPAWLPEAGWFAGGRLRGGPRYVGSARTIPPPWADGATPAYATARRSSRGCASQRT